MFFRTLTDGPLDTLVLLTVVNTSNYFRFLVYWCLPISEVPLLSRETVCTPIAKPSHSLGIHSIPPDKLLGYVPEMWFSYLLHLIIFIHFPCTSHIRSHCLVHSPLHTSTCCNPICLVTRYRHHDDVDSHHPKYTVSDTPISKLPLLYVP